MEKYRCLNNPFGYCSSEPKATTKDKEWSVTPDSFNQNTGKKTESAPACKLDRNTCRKYAIIPEVEIKT